MSASLGATTYTSVVWTAGDVITEAKLDNMVANDQAYDSHSAQGLLLDNNKSFAGKTTGPANRNLIKMNTSNIIEIGDTDLSGQLQENNGRFQTPQTYTPAGAGTTTLDLTKGNTHIITMPANTQTIAISGGVVGEWFNVQINNVTSQGALTWFTTIRWDRGVAGTLTGTNGKRDSFMFYVSGAGTYDGYVVGKNI